MTAAHQASEPLPPCPDVVKAYHEAGHAALDLVYGYGLAYCSIEPQGEETGGEARRISEAVADGHYIRIMAAGIVAEKYSGHDFKRYPCKDGWGGDMKGIQPFLLAIAEIPESDWDPTKVTQERRDEIEGIIGPMYDQIFYSVEREFESNGWVPLLEEIAGMLMEHKTLPKRILDGLNARYPLSS